MSEPMSDSAYLTPGVPVIHVDSGAIITPTETVVVHVHTVEDGIADCTSPGGLNITVDNSQLVYRLEDV